MTDGSWDRYRFKGTELAGKLVAVIGYGRLGRNVAHYLLAFGAQVLAVDPFVVPASLEPGIAASGLLEALESADIVTLHVGLGPATTRFFGRDQFNAMKRGARFVNTARGELIDEAALLDALTSGRLAGAALDVLSDENANGMGSHPLVQHARSHHNLLITPHLGGCTDESLAKTEIFMAAKLLTSSALAMLMAGEVSH